MKKLTASQKEIITHALKQLESAAQDLSNALDETEYTLRNEPTYLSDIDDFTYEISTFVQDEIEELTPNKKLTLVV